MEKLKKEEWLSVFMDHLRNIIEKPPYIIFIFISPILLIIVLFWWHEYVKFFLVFFLYSVFGVVWRHFIKDIRGRIKKLYSIKKFNKINLYLTVIYQLGNFLLVIILLLISAKFIF